MNRRDFLRRSAIVAAGVVAADQLALLDRLGWKRRFFPGWGNTNIPPKLWADGIHDDTAALQWLIVVAAMSRPTPFVARPRSLYVAPPQHHWTTVVAHG